MSFGGGVLDPFQSSPRPGHLVTSLLVARALFDRRGAYSILIVSRPLSEMVLTRFRVWCRLLAV